MASHVVRLHPLAADEAEGARAWYSARNPTVADAFLLELDAAIAKLPNACVKSGLDGSFTIPAQHGWMIYIVPIDLFGFGGTLNIDAPGYQHADLPYYAPGTGSGVIPFDIKLTRSP